MAGLKFIAISGSTGVTQNLYVYEHGNDLIVIDCGIGFPDSDMYGVDLVLPDFEYLRRNRKKIRGILITHGHEDHLGGLPFLLKEIRATIYATKLTAGFIEDKLDDYKIRDRKIEVFDPERDVLTLGVFKITPFRVSHSVPDAVGYCLDTPEGMAMHIPDYKFDWTPVDGRPFDVGKLSMLASDGVLVLASDSLGAMSQGSTQSERAIEGKIEEIAREARGQIFLTTISSNISRMQQAINVSSRLNRKVTINGRSLDRKFNIAKDLGYIKVPKGTILSTKKARHFKRDQIMHIVTGTYGQDGSALYKVVHGTHDYLKIHEGDTVIFSGDPSPPGAKQAVDELVDGLIDRNINVHYYDVQEDLHVSGHGSREDIKLLFGLVRPKYYIPIGGTIRHNREYKKIAEGMGVSVRNVFELKPGWGVEFDKGGAKRTKALNVKEIYLDGLEAGDVGNIVLRDRQILATDGVAIVVLKVSKSAQKLISLPEIISRGFVFEKKKKGFLESSQRDLEQYLSKKHIESRFTLKNDVANYLEKYFWQKTKRRPMILPVVIEL